MSTLSIAEARRQFASLIDVVGSGQTVVITRRGRAVARLVSTQQGGKTLPSRSAARQALLAEGARVSPSVVATMRDEERS